MLELDSADTTGQVADALVGERHVARHIAQEVVNYGVSERQKLAVIKCLAEQLEDFELMKLLCWFIDEAEHVRFGDHMKLAELRASACSRMDLIMELPDAGRR